MSRARRGTGEQPAKLPLFVKPPGYREGTAQPIKACGK